MREAVASRDDRARNLDGALLRAVGLKDGVSFEACRLRGAIFDSVLAERANFFDADLRWAEFPDARLPLAEFPDADLQRAEFPDANLRWAEFPDADLSSAEFPDADLGYAEFPNADLPGAEFPDADLSSAEFPDAYLRYSKFPDAYLKWAEFPDAYLYEVEFLNADLRYSKFPDADLYKSQFPDADLTGAEFPEATLYRADFPDADLKEAQFADADLRGANFSAEHSPDDGDNDSDDENQTNTNHDPTNLEDAVLQNADLRGADFTNARLDQADFSDARINTETTFDSETIYERDQKIGSKVERAEESAPPPGAWVQRRLERLHDENALSTTARKFHVRKQRAKQTHYAQKREWSLSTLDDWVQWGRLVTYEKVMGYGENPWRVGLTALVIVLLWAVAYPFGGWVRPVEESQPLSYPDPTTADSALAFYGGVWQTFLDSLYFSGVTFTTLGFGDFRPVGFGRLLATAEAGLGVTLFAILVFVLGRRVAR